MIKGFAPACWNRQQIGSASWKGLLLLGIICGSVIPSLADTITLRESAPGGSTAFAGGVQAGTVLLCDGPISGNGCGPGVQVSDAVSFSSFAIPGLGTVSVAAFCSDTTGGADSGDACSPATPTAPTIALVEQGTPEYFESTPYTPISGQPGFSAANAGRTYNLISDDATPEPTTFVLMSSALLAVGFFRRRMQA